MDLLDDILGTLDLTGALYFRTDFSPPWAITVPELAGAARFHLVVQGRCHVAVGDAESVELGPGDLILVPRGRSHVLADRPDRTPAPLERVLEQAGFEGSGVLALGNGDPQAATQMICGHYTFRSEADHPLLRGLPDYLLVPAAVRAGEPWLDDMLRMIARRLFADEMGSEAAVTRLSEIVFIELLRIGMAQSETLRAVLTAFQDRQVGNALRLIHARPDEAWTVESLARAIGMSRSRFAERFRDLMGSSPMAYLSDWRLQKALSLLDDSRCSVQQVAVRTGYRSPAAFSRAFSGKFGVPPTSYRRRAG